VNIILFISFFVYLKQLYSVQESINYTCLDKNSYRTLDVKFNVIVEKPPVLRNSKNETLQAIHGSNVTLECELYPNNIETKIYWLQVSIGILKRLIH